MSDKYDEQARAITGPFDKATAKLIARILRAADANAREAQPLPPPVCTGTGAVVGYLDTLASVTTCPICAATVPVMHGPTGSVIAAHAYRPPVGGKAL